jgi:hypothetical protein
MSGPHVLRVSTPLLLAIATAMLIPRVEALDLESRTAAAYAAYLEDARKAFVARANGDTSLGVASRDQIVVEAARGTGIVAVPGGIVHHWTAKVVATGLTLQRALDLSRTYDKYPSVYASIVECRLLQQDGETYRIVTRVKEEYGGVGAVLQVQSTIRFTRVSVTRAYSESNADEIRQVENAGRPDEYLLAAGQDSGYLWRGNVLTSFVAVPGGVAIETQTIGLSRRFPPLLGWFFAPIAKRIGRKSVETTLQEFLVATRSL